MVFPRLLGSLRLRDRYEVGQRAVFPDAPKNVMASGHECSLLDWCFTRRPTKRPRETSVAYLSRPSVIISRIFMASASIVNGFVRICVPGSR